MRGVVVSLFFAMSSVVSAQSTETPVAFDGGQRVVAVTPAVATRLQLTAPTWPVVGVYREARLYSIEPGGGFVLVVQLSNGALQRFPLSASERNELGAAIEAAMRTAGSPSAEATPDLASEPAGNAFARHQTFLAATIYGPLAASLADNGGAAGGLYLATTGLAFFVSYASAQSTPFTRAQSDLAGSLGLSAAVGAGLLGYSATGDFDRGVRAVTLGSGIAGTIAGVSLGARLSDAEAHAAKLGIETAAATATTVAGVAGADGRSIALAAALAGGLGYPIGVHYPRRASYTVTAGDVEAASTAGLVGVIAGGAGVAAIDNPSAAQYAGFLGGGYLTGVALGDLAIARRFDLTQAQSNVLNIGALAGALLGFAAPTISGDDHGALPFALAAGGAVLGMTGIASTFHVATRSGEGFRQSDSRGLGGGTGLRLSFMPGGLAAAASRAPGNHVLARLVF